MHAAGIGFTNTRFPSADWKTIKPTTPLVSVPVLNINGTDHVQSLALMRYAAKLGGFYPTDHDHPLQALVVDEVMETCSELMSKAPRSRDKEELKRLRQEFQENTMTRYSSFLEGIVSKNKESTGSSLVVGTTVKVADLSVHGRPCPDDCQWRLGLRGHGIFQQGLPRTHGSVQGCG